MSARTSATQGLSLQPRPLQKPLEVWLGGTARSALRRAGRLSDGWLPSLCTPEEAAAGRDAIQAAAAEVGRQVDPEHFGISMSYARDADSARPGRANRQTPARPRPGQPHPRRHAQRPREMLRRYVDVGFSKFVLRPGETPHSWPAELEDLAEGVLSLQT